MASTANPYESATFGNSLSLRVDGAIGAMSLSPNGRDAVLAGRRGLFIIDLDDPFTAPRWLHHITSWEVADVQWLPHMIKPSWCISTSNQKALLWDLARPSNNAILNVLHKHARAITDINFHPQDPEVLATCLIDTFVYSWDMRTPRRPVGKWAEWRAGATQVKWNHGNAHQVCLSHHHSFYVWDTRKGALPVLKVENAHGGKINGLDFSSGRLVTCANDNTVKVWDTSASDVRLRSGVGTEQISPTVTIHTTYPVARARPLPFGRDSSCGIMPLRGGDNSVHVVNYDAAWKRARTSGTPEDIDADAAYTFKGHRGAIKDFLWRTQHAYAGRAWREYQLVTWSSLDYDLKLWRHDEALYDAVNYHPEHQRLIGSLGEAGEKEQDGIKDQGKIDKSGHERVKEMKNEKLNTDTLLESKLESENATSIMPALNQSSAESVDVAPPARPPLPGKKVSLPDTMDSAPASSSQESSASTPQSEISEEMAVAFPYTSYCPEPPLASTMTVDSSDMLSTWALFKIRQNQENDGSSSQVNHLNWISGVRMGTGHEDDDDPVNLGEEVSVVAHKFPKIRFEKILVSTGHLVLLMRGPLPNSEEKETEQEKDKGKEKIKETREREESVDSSFLNISANAQNSSHLNANNTGGTSASPTGPHTHANTGASIPSQNIPQNILSQPLTKLPSRSAINTQSISETTPPILSTNEQEQKLVFIRLDIRFPKMYPYLEELDRKMRSRHRRSNMIRFAIEETHELPSRVRNEMLDNLNRIAHFYTNKYNKFCLEPCLRYLLGDKIELNDSSMLENANAPSVKNLEELGTPEVDDTTQHDASGIHISADDDDDFDGDIIPTVDDNLTHSGEFTKTSSSSSAFPNIADGGIRHDSTPVPKGCGAVWSRNGRLVCFFIPKCSDHELEKPLQKFNIFKFTESGFGLKNHRHSSVGTGSDMVSVSSDEEDRGLVSSDDESNLEEESASSDSGSSDMSFSNDWDEMLEDDVPSRSRIPGLFKGSVGLGRNILAQENVRASINRTISGRGTGSNYKSSLHDDSNLRSTRKTKRIKKGKNIVAIFDFSHLLPDKYELACDYRVLGDTPDSLARHNFEVAKQYGYMEIANVWKVVEMILIKDVHLDDVPDIGRDLMYASGDENGRFYWGNHPFGHAWLVKELFTYFEKRGNLQMLAMLSCILFENISNIHSSTNGAFAVPIHTPYSAVPPRPTLSAMREYGFISPGVDASEAENTPLGQASYFNPSPISRKNSTLSGRATLLSRLVSDSLDPHIRTESPGKVSTVRKIFPSSPYVDALSMEQTNMKLARLFDSTKKLTKAPIPRKSIRSIQMRKSTLVNNGAQKWRQRPPPSLTVEMKNVAELDLFDTVYSTSLLSDMEPAKIWSYRDQYADMLYSWGLPFHRIKILKFNFPEEIKNRESSSAVDVHKCKYGFRNRKALAPSQLLLTPITTVATANDNAWNTRKRSKLQYCGLCGLLISKRVVICANCEHVLHSHCAVSWWSVDNVIAEDQELECPTGCGCLCLEHTL